MNFFKSLFFLYFVFEINKSQNVLNVQNNGTIESFSYMEIQKAILKDIDISKDSGHISMNYSILVF